MYLLDTNVISELAPTKAAASQLLQSWIHDNATILFISVVTASEIEGGITKAERTGANSKAAILRSWWSKIEVAWSDRLLPFDLKAAHAAGRMADHARAHRPQYQDLAIAATAQVHGLTVLTHNEKHFEPLDVPFLNPLHVRA